MARTPQSRRQISRQKHRDTTGRYDSVHPCYCCGKSAGEDYLSHPLTDCTGPDGKDWGDIALCLCEKCERATHTFDTTAQFCAYRDLLAKRKR